VVVKGSRDEAGVLKANNMKCKARDVVTINTGGGGGFGNPWDRDPESVLRDVLDGYVSKKGAERDYGVVLTQDREIDKAATESRRDKLAGGGG
jgi:N-methylhydantoinase B